MTTRTAPPPASHPAVEPGGEPGPLVSAPAHRDETFRTASLVGGVGILLMAAIAVFANFVVVEGLVTPGDAAATASDVTAAEGMFRFGIVGWFAIAALDVAVAWALLRVFSPVSRNVSRLAAWLRLAYAGVLVVAITELLSAIRILTSSDYLSVFTSDEIAAHAMLRIEGFTGLYDAGLILFGLHLVVLGYLAYRSGFVPKLVGALLVVAGIGYLVDSVSAVLGTPTNIAVVTFIGEFLLALWLVFRGARRAPRSPVSEIDSIGVAR